jgi:hypothetical protein
MGLTFAKLLDEVVAKPGSALIHVQIESESILSLARSDGLKISGRLPEDLVKSVLLFPP